LRPNVSALIVRDHDPAARRQTRALFPTATVFASGGPLPPDPFGTTAINAVTKASHPVVLVDPFNLGNPRTEDVDDCRNSRLFLCALATLPAAPVTLAWYPLFRNNRHRGIELLRRGIEGVMATGGRTGLVSLIEMRWASTESQFMCGSGVLVFNAGPQLLESMTKAAQRVSRVIGRRKPQTFASCRRF
jgi:23S rRNA A2030 N6-methylase RlmJ